MIETISDIKLNPITWDIVIENNDIKFVGETDGIQQHLRQILQTFKGECPFDLTRGIPYHDEFFKKNFNPIIIDSILKNAIIDVPGVIELQEFILDIDNATRILSINFKVLTKYNEVINYSDYIPIG